MMNIHSIMRVVTGVACLGLAQGGLATTVVTVNGNSCGNLTNLSVVEAGAVTSAEITTDETSCLASDPLPISAKADTFMGIGMGISPLDILKNDTYLVDPDGKYPLTLKIASQPDAGLGSVAVSGQSIAYTPSDEPYVGQVTFEYGFSQAGVDVSPAKVTLDVDTTAPPVCDETNDKLCVFDLPLSNTKITRSIARLGKHIYRFTPGTDTVVRGHFLAVEVIGKEVELNMGISSVSGRSIALTGDNNRCFTGPTLKPSLDFVPPDDKNAKYYCPVAAGVEMYLTIENTEDKRGGYSLTTNNMNNK